MSKRFVLNVITVYDFLELFLVIVYVEKSFMSALNRWKFIVVYFCLRIEERAFSIGIDLFFY